MEVLIFLYRILPAVGFGDLVETYPRRWIQGQPIAGLALPDLLHRSISWSGPGPVGLTKMKWIAVLSGALVQLPFDHEQTVTNRARDYMSKSSAITANQTSVAS
jgi:hypothetical protein